MSKPATLGVIGAGAWGTALAQMLASDGRDVLLWAFEPEVVVIDPITNLSFDDDDVMLKPFIAPPPFAIAHDLLKHWLDQQ